MSIVNTSIRKQPLNRMDIPLNKFKEEVIPHHQKHFEQYKTLIVKLIAHGDVPRVNQEIKNSKRIVKQLKDLMYELDTLRTQVANEELDKFDTRTLSLRKTILGLISGYGDLEKKAFNLLAVNQEESEKLILESNNPFEGASQIQLQDNLEDIKLKQQLELLDEVENINRDAQELNEIFTQLSTMVEEQREHVDVVEENVENANENVRSGLKQLIKAHKLRTVAYPVTGAFLGTIIGGPIGLVAGLKVGSLAALGCAIAGYTGGTIFKKVKDVEEIPAETVPISENVRNDPPQEKKSI